MPTPSNIEKFNEVAAKTFALLYESFPVGRELNFDSDFHIDQYEEFFQSQKDYPAVGQEIEFHEQTIQWLAKAGYLFFRHYNYPEAITGAVLSAIGFDILNSAPLALTSGQTLGTFLIEAVKAGDAEARNSVMRFILAEGSKRTPFVVNVMSN